MFDNTGRGSGSYQKMMVQSLYNPVKLGPIFMKICDHYSILGAHPSHPAYPPLSGAKRIYLAPHNRKWANVGTRAVKVS